MTPDELYKKILRTITQVRNARATRAQTITGLPAENLCATDSALDDMARNAAQALIDLLEKQFSVEDVKAAFWKTFHEHGEVWFDYVDVKERWTDFVENLPSHAQGDADA